MPARMQATAEDKRTAEDRPTGDYLETTRTFWQPYAERELTREDAREMAHNLIGFFTVLREWILRERERTRCGVVETASSPHGGSVEDCARVLRQKIKCSLDAELICSLARGLIQCALAARGRT